MERLPGAVDSIIGRNAPRDLRPSETRAAVSYDAASVIGFVAGQVFTAQAAPPTAGGVFAALDDPGEGPLWNGASGVLQFTGRDDGHVVEDKPVLLATVRAGGAVEVKEVCGRLVTGHQARADCPAGDGVPSERSR
ncbi:MAG TPA: hypothetical protein VFV01_47635 [Spirillospora sp.]|nr:hypothetical protein [Spirillospora sp.]